MTAPYRRERKNKKPALEAKFEAQKLAFAPLSFQAAKTMRDIGILAELQKAGEAGITALSIIKSLKLSEYTVNTLLEVGVVTDMVTLHDGKYKLAALGNFILNDEMTRINMDFVADVCYQGAFHLKESFLNEKPEGLKVFGKWPTVYEGLAHLPEHVQKSWFAFDHYYSDIAFPAALPIVFARKPKNIFDIGGNTGKWALECLEYNNDVHVTILDLPGQLAKAEKNLKQKGFGKRSSFHEINMLDKAAKIPKGADVIWMSQFLDCFSKEQIIAILKKAASAIDKNARVFILEPLWDTQSFKAAAYSLNHTSLYFTAIANGNSKMYSADEMRECVREAGLKIAAEHHGLGENEYSLLECSL